MANCTIQVTGTNGQVLLSYELGGQPSSLIAGIGAKLTIDDTLYTNIKYHTIIGDAIATGCAITEASENIDNFTIAVGGYELSAIIINDNYHYLSAPESFTNGSIENLKEQFLILGLKLKSITPLTDVTTAIEVSKFNNENIELEFSYQDGIYLNKIYLKTIIAN